MFRIRTKYFSLLAKVVILKIFQILVYSTVVAYNLKIGKLQVSML